MKRAFLIMPLASSFLVAACDNTTTVDTNVNAIRGEYLVKTVLACGDCHTTPQANGLPSFNPSDFLAGGREFDVTIAGVAQKFYARNLTADTDNGIGSWTDDQIKGALTKGIDDQGEALSPIMPYSAFANLASDDLDSIVLYLRSLAKSTNAVPDNTVATDKPGPLIDPATVPHTTLAATDKNFASAERGRYLAGLAGACIHCHTPPGKTADQALDMPHAFAGGQLFPIAPPFYVTVSANLTPDITGLATWSAADIISTVQWDKEKGVGRALCPPMPGGPNRAGDMTPGDLTDIATFLTTLAPVENGPFGCTDAGVPFGQDGAF